MTTNTITGRDAIAHAERTGARLHKYADPTEGAREITVAEAYDIAREDASLVYCEAPAPRHAPTGRAARAIVLVALLLLGGRGMAADASPIAAAIAARKVAIDAADDRIVAATRAWLAAANLDALPVPQLGSDPRRSDADRRTDIEQINGTLTVLREERATATPGLLLNIAENPVFTKHVADAEAIRAGDKLPAAEAPAAKPHHAPAGGIIPAAR